MKRKKLEKVGIYVGVFAVVIIIFGIFLILNIDKKSNINLEKEEKSKLHRGLEIGLIILVIILAILGLIIGFIRLFHGDKKKYLSIDKELEDEYKLKFGDNVYYLKKKDLK